MQEQLKKHGYALVAFCLPFSVMIGVLAGSGCAPFGNRCLMIVDALHQYLPFFADYQEKLKNFDSLFYSWNGGLGYNFFSLWAYYLSSPLNLIIAVIPKTWMFGALDLIIAIKFSLCSFTAYLYFSHKWRKEGLQNVAFGLCYAFSSYMTGYYWNVMWLEVMILLPIVMLGLDRLMKKKDGTIYCLALFGMMICNYYMTFMVCIFLALWYFTYTFTGWKDFIQKGVRFAGASLLSAGMSAIVLLPAYLGLMTTYSAKLEFPKWEFYKNGWELFSTHMAGVIPYNMSVNDGLGNLYCGILPIVLLLLYMIDRKKKWKEKLVRIVILAFMVISFEVEILNYIWHGFHNQYGIPNRFAFIYIFLILIMAYDQIQDMKQNGTVAWKVLGAMTVSIAGIIACYEHQVLDTNLPYLISIGLIVVYGALLMGRSIWCRKIIPVIMIIELGISCIYGMYHSGNVDCQYYFGDTKSIEKIVEKEQPDKECRMELLHSKMLDESIWHTMPNATMFGSTALGNTVEAMDQLGFYTGVNEYLYEGGTPFTDSLLGIRSILVRHDDHMTRTKYEYLYSIDNVSLYQNNNMTALGYWTNDSLKRWDHENSNPFEVQNDFIKQAYGISDLFVEKEISLPVGNDCDITDHGDGYYYVESKQSLDDNVTFIFTADKSEELYLHFDCASVDYAELLVNGIVEQKERLNSQILSVGYLEPGDTVSLKLRLNKNNGTGITMRAATLDSGVFSKLQKEMKDAKFFVDQSSTTKVKGHINAKKDGYIFFSIPYDQGWNVMLDGKNAETVSLAKGFLGVKVPYGTHTIEMKYASPGFWYGMGISIFSIGIFLCCKKIFRKKSEI